MGESIDKLMLQSLSSMQMPSEEPHSLCAICPLKCQPRHKTMNACWSCCQKHVQTNRQCALQSYFWHANGRCFYFSFAFATSEVAHKTEAHGIRLLVLWIGSFLSNRLMWVVVNGQYSSWSVVISGVPQGYTDRSKETLIPLYKCLDRPHPEYCCSIWNLHNIKVLTWSKVCNVMLLS